MKRFALSLFIGGAIAALSVATAVVSPPSITGTWSVQQTGLNGTSTSTITITQSGTGIVGKNSANGTGFTGTFATDSQINGTWKGPGGAGWLTVSLAPTATASTERGVTTAATPRLVRRQQSTAALADHRGRNVGLIGAGTPAFRRKNEVHAVGSHGRLPRRASR